MASLGKRYALIAAATIVCLFVVVLMYHHGGQANTSIVIQDSSLRTEPVKVWPQCREYSDDSAAPAQVLSKELVVRRDVFDSRRRDGYPNTIVFVMEAKGMTLNKEHFYGCQVGHFFQTIFFFGFPKNINGYKNIGMPQVPWP